jgi:hypothetical protein
LRLSWLHTAKIQSQCATFKKKEELANILLSHIFTL